MATVTLVYIGRELPSLYWLCWDSSVAMAASQRAGRWTPMLLFLQHHQNCCRSLCSYLASLMYLLRIDLFWDFNIRSVSFTLRRGFFLLKAVVSSVFLCLNDCQEIENMLHKFSFPSNFPSNNYTTIVVNVKRLMLKSWNVLNAKIWNAVSHWKKKLSRFLCLSSVCAMLPNYLST